MLSFGIPLVCRHTILVGFLSKVHKSPVPLSSHELRSANKPTTSKQRKPSKDDHPRNDQRIEDRLRPVVSDRVQTATSKLSSQESR